MKLQGKEIKSVPISYIHQIENSRITYEKEEMAELMTSLKQRGLLNPIGVRKTNDNKGYEVVFGNRRLVAAQKLDWKYIDAILIDGIDSNEDMLIVNAVENMQRSDVPLAEQGRIFDGLTKAGLSAKEIAAKIGINAQKVSRAIDIYRVVPAEMRTKVTFGRPGLRLKEGKIPATTVANAISVASRSGLSRAQTNDLLRFSTKDGITSSHLLRMGSLVRSGHSFSSAKKQIDNTRVVTISVAIPSGHVKKLEKEYKSRIHNIIYSHLSSERWLGIVRANESPKTILRKAQRRKK